MIIKLINSLFQVVTSTFHFQADNDQPEIATYSRLANRNTRKQAVSKFYTLLVLKKQQSIQLTQSHPYAEIFIEQGDKAEIVF